MSREDMLWVAARLLTERGYRQDFFRNDEGSAAAHGLLPEEFQTLRRIDPHRLGIASEGYTGKRFEHVETVFPRTLAILDAIHPSTRRDYLDQTPFPEDEAAEEQTFAEYVRSRPTPPHLKRFLQDLVDVESRLYSTPRPPGPPSYRFQDSLRPVASPYAFTLQTQGPLHRIPLAPLQIPDAYKAAPHHVLVLRRGDEVVVEEMDASAQHLLAACDGNCDVAALVGRFGGPARDLIRRWMDCWVLTAGSRGPPGTV